MRQVIRDLRIERANGQLPPFQVLELNCMALPSPTAVYSELYAAVTGSRGVSAPHAAQLLEQRYMRNDLDGENDSTDHQEMVGVPKPKGRRKTKSKVGVKGNVINKEDDDGVIIVVLDEMDVLLARKQKVVYDLLEWPSRQNARIAMIGIANTMDLPERMLPRMGSRLGLNRLVYPPYTSEELKVIIRLVHPPTEVNNGALQLCAAKIGGVSGDVRRALQLCRRAMEISSAKPITPNDMQTAIQEAAGNFRFRALAQLALLERVTLACIVTLSRSLLQTDDADSAALGGCSIDNVSERAWNAAVRHNLGLALQHIDFEDACFRLANLRLVVIDKHFIKRSSRVILNLPVDDCIHGLENECDICKAILSDSANGI